MQNVKILFVLCMHVCFSMFPTIQYQRGRGGLGGAIAPQGLDESRYYSCTCSWLAAGWDQSGHRLI